MLKRRRRGQRRGFGRAGESSESRESAQPLPPVEPPPVAPEDAGDGSVPGHGVWHAAGEEVLR